MINIFDSLQKYASKWNVTASRKFNDDEISAISRAEVVSSNYGLSVCFYLNGGGQSYIPLDTNSTLSEGAIVNVSEATLLTLSKDGEADIHRVSI